MSIRSAFESWAHLNSAIRGAVAPLTPSELAASQGPHRWPLWAVVGHLACQRVFWLCEFAGEPGVETTPFPNSAWSCPGDEDLTNVLDGPQLAAALDSTGAIVERVLDTWTFDSLGEVIDHSDWDPGWVHTRGFVIDRVHSHDLWHAAEASEILTVLGRDPIGAWGP